MKKKIFAIDDEKDILEILKVNLNGEGYEVHTFLSTNEASKQMEISVPDLILLDIMLEGTSGYDFCKTLRSSQKFKSIPVIFISAKTEEFDKVLGLELGGDDYITKPFSMKELKSRVKAVLRRSSPAIENAEENGRISYKGVELFTDSFTLRIDGKDTPLTKTEFKILELFLMYPNKIFTRDNIIDSIKGNEVFVIDRTIDVHIMNLRKKLSSYKNIIKTFSGVGYGFKKD